MYASIVIPTYNRCDQLRDTLISVAGVTSGIDDIEILIVDNGSTDRTAEMCRTIQEQYPGNAWRYSYENMPGLLTGRHRGAKKAVGEIVAFLDDDIQLAPTWLDALRDAFKDPAVVLAGGRAIGSYEVAPPEWMETLWWEFDGSCRALGPLSLVDLGNDIRKADPNLVFGLNFVIRRSALFDFGGFHPDCVPKALQRYQGDGETGLTLKMKEKGIDALYHPGMSVTHVIPRSRLTMESLEQRGFYQGVCDSFTQIRVAGGVAAGADSGLKKRLRPLKEKLYSLAGRGAADARGAGEIMARGYAAGVSFHQREVRSDPELLRWVLKPDYFDYQLPSGWEKYLG